MKKILITLVCLLGYISYVQAQDSTAVYKKRVLETMAFKTLKSQCTRALKSKHVPFKKKKLKP